MCEGEGWGDGGGGCVEGGGDIIICISNISWNHVKW